MTLTIHPDVRAITAPHILLADDLLVAPRHHLLDVAIASAEEGLRAADAALDAALMRTRVMYRRMGLDPTRTRPSSEALLRRLRKGERLPSINTLVDVVNWCSVEAQVPFGLYDRAALGEPLVVRLGHAGEGYVGIRKDHVNVDGRLVVADAEGAFGNPTSDSARTMVSDTTRDVLVVVFFPVDTPEASMRHTLDCTRERLTRFCARPSPAQ